MTVVFKKSRCVSSGMDLCSLSVGGFVVREILDPWTVKVVKEVLTSLSIQYEEINDEDISKVFRQPYLG